VACINDPSHTTGELEVEFHRKGEHSLVVPLINKMTDARNSSLLPSTPRFVGTVHSEGSLHAAARLTRGAVDFLELRVDAFAADPEALFAAAGRLKIPRIVTVRHPAEGGAGPLGMAQRRVLFRRFLPLAHSIDVELRSVGALGEVIAAARERGVRLIVSAHDFHRTPSTAVLQRQIAAAHLAGADVCKVAVFTETPADLARLVALFARRSPVPLSVMGMGSYGKVSRLLFARLGSVLNYGYLHRPNASGQWEARELKQRVREL